MAKGGRGKKKAQAPLVPLAEGKRTGDPSRLLPASNNSTERVCWRFQHVDQEGPWGITDGAFAMLLPELAKFETMTMHELFRQGEWPGKCHDTAALPTRQARERLDTIGLADMTQIWKLRIGSRGRLWGFLEGNVFHVVWWDPEHEIWPTKLKHT